MIKHSWGVDEQEHLLPEMWDGVGTTTKVQKRTKRGFPVIFVISASELAERLSAGVILLSRHCLSFLC